MRDTCHIGCSVLSILAILLVVWWYLIAVLICISLMNVMWSILFILFAIYVFSLVTCLFGSLANFLIGLFTFLSLSLKCSLYILDNSSLSRVSLQIFSPSLTFLLILLTRSFAEQKSLILMKFSLSVFSFIDHAFGVVFKKSSLYLRSPRFSSTF